MPFRQFYVDQYAAVLGSKMRRGEMAYQAEIRCRSKDGHELSILFLNKDRGGAENDSDQYPNETDNGDVVKGLMFVPIQQYPFYLDLFRNQEPILAWVGWGAHLQGTFISTGEWEDIGSGEVAQTVGD